MRVSLHSISTPLQHICSDEHMVMSRIQTTWQERFSTKMMPAKISLSRHLSMIRIFERRGFVSNQQVGYLLLEILQESCDPSHMHMYQTDSCKWISLTHLLRDDSDVFLLVSRLRILYIDDARVMHLLMIRVEMYQ